MVVILVALVVFVGVMIATHLGKQEVASTPVTTPTIEATIAPTPAPTLDALQTQVQEMINGFGEGQWSVYVKDESNSTSFTINSMQTYSASLIKLFTAGCYYEQLQEGNLVDSDYNQNLLRLMISESDNDAWEALETVIGQGNYDWGLQLVTEFAQSHGYTDTGRLIDPDGTTNFFEGENYTSVTDVGNVLDSIYQGTYVSEECSSTILEHMLNQIEYHRNKIPAGLPEGVDCANKSGELDDCENDSAIIYSDNTDYILVVMSNEHYDTELACEEIAELSTLVYNYFNGDFETTMVEQ